MGHTTGTLRAGEIRFYRGFKGMLLIGRVRNNNPIEARISPTAVTPLAGAIPCAPRHRARLRFVLQPT